VERSEPDLDRVLHGTLFDKGVLAADVATLLADERGFYIAVNDEACRLTGYSRAQLTRLRAGELAADARSRAIYTQLLNGRKIQGRKLVRREDGSIVHCRYWGIKTAITRLPYFLVLIWPTRPPKRKPIA
jgi:PAS domain S-box-containing protein